MKAQDLRIGNFGRDVIKGRLVEIIGIDATWNSVWVRYGNRSDYKIDVDTFEPYELTKEWMIKFGFNLFPWGWVKDDILIRWSIHNQMFWVELGAGVNIGLCHVHTLQNFMALTGRELTIK